MMMAPLRGPEPGRLLVAALLKRLPAGTTLIEQDRTPWASATFAGTQHRLVLHCPDIVAGTALAATASEAEFPLRGHLLADIEAAMQDEFLTITALTLVAA